MAVAGRIAGGAQVAPLQAALLRDPIAFLSAEHARQTVLLGHLARLAQGLRGPGRRGLAAMLAGWLGQEMPLHFADEEASLYPRLAAFDSAGVLPGLAAEHRRDRLVGDVLLAELRRIAEGQPPAPGFAAAALGFASDHRRHLAQEEALVPPLARLALDEPALAALAAEMLARRQRG